MPKAPKSPGAREQRHNPLAEEYAPSDPWKQKPAKRQKRTKDDQAQDKYVDSKSSRKILDIGRELEEEDERETRVQRPDGANPAFDFESRMGDDDAEIDGSGHIDDDEAWGEDDDEVEEVEIDANDLAAWNKFIPTDENPIVWPGEEAQPSAPGTDLAALILEKIAAHEATDGAVKQPEILGGGAPEDAIELPAKVVEGTSHLLSRPGPSLTLYSLLQDWLDHEPLQVRQAPEALQDPAHHPRLGDAALHHTPRKLDA
jgi:essential nuclear protein 1